MFLNLDADRAEELFVGGVGPIGFGSSYVLDYVSDTTWRVMWVDSSLRSSPLSVTAGILDGDCVLAAANTWDRSPQDTFFTELHVYHAAGNTFGTWRRDSASLQTLHLTDIDNDGTTNLIAAVLSHLIPDHTADYEYSRTTSVAKAGTHIERFELYPNYPNPFNNETSISFSLPASGHVTMAVYDILGREIATLENGYREAGFHSVTWDASGTSSGMYLLRMRVVEISGGSTYTAVKKMIVMK